MYDNSQTADIASEYPLIHPTTGRSYREVEIDGVIMYEYPPNREGYIGAIWNPETKKLYRGTAPLITSENAAAMQALGKEKIKQDIIDGMREAVASKRKKPVGEISDATVRQALGQAVMEHALDAEAAGSAHVKRLAAELGGMLPDKRQAEVKDGRGNVVSGDVEFVERILRLAQEASARNQGDIDDGS